MAKPEPIRGEITVKLSQTDRELLKAIIRGLGIDPDDEKSFADTAMVFGTGNNGMNTASDTVRRLIERPDPSAEGDWLLEADHEAGDDVD